jgi:hypothetical protein
MALTFPSNPQINDVYTSGDTTWIYTGIAWKVTPVTDITATNLVVTGEATLEGVTAVGATGTGNLVYSNSPTFTGTVSGITAAMVGLGDVTNESKAVMFTNPVFTGQVSGINSAAFNLENVTNESKETMFTSPTFTGTVSGVTAAMVGLGNVANESKAVMFTSPTISNPTLTGTTISANLTVNQLLATHQSTETLNTKTGATGVVVHDFSTGAIFEHTGISANFTANFTNVPTTSNRTIVVTLILNQGATARIPNVVQINGAAQTINWLNWEEPLPNSNKIDIVSFSLVRSVTTWKVFGSLSSFG